LLRLKRNLFATYRASNGLSHDIITTVMEARDGSLWAGTNCGGVNVIDSSRHWVRTYMPGPPGPNRDPCVFSLAQDSAGVVWVGTYGGGLTRIADGRATNVGGLGVLRDSVILALFTDRRGTLWVGTNASGLAEVSEERVRRVYTTADGLASNSIRTIAQTRDGALWVGTLEGLSRFGVDGHVATYRASDGLTSGYVRALYEENDGTLWIGTYGGGLNRLRDGKFTHVTVADGLPDNVVSSILDDGHGNLWMSGNRGVYRVSKDQLNRCANGELRHVHSVLYGTGDGLVSAETNGGFQPAAWRDRSGHLWFPTIKGLTTVDPAAEADGSEAPAVTLEDVLVDGETRGAGPSLRIGPGRPNVEFRYTAPSLSAPDNVTFRYRLRELDDRWIEPGGRRVAYYSRLPAGTYHFDVAAANRDGAWSPAQASITLVVLSPLYRRAWFIATLLALVVLVTWSAHRRTLMTRSEAVRDERSRLAREIHDSLLQGFGGIALQLHAASARLSLTREQQPLLDRVQTMIDNTLKQAREAVWDIRPLDVTGVDFRRECEDAGRRVFSATATELHVTAHGHERALSAESRVECLRIVEEALTNVRKHAEATRVSVELRYGWRSLDITISDNGKGFEVDHARQRPGHWGWLGMRERASRVGARLGVRSIVGAGTIVMLSAPYRTGIFARLRQRARKA
jgi:signal transduction histidine kinase/streptogramin lyase